MTMDRTDILRSPEYWTAKTQLQLYACAVKFMEETGRDRTRLAEYLGVSKGYVSQLLNGDYAHRLSKFFELALAFGYIPKIEFVPAGKFIEENVPVNTPGDCEWDETPELNKLEVEYSRAIYPSPYNGVPKIAA